MFDNYFKVKKILNELLKLNKTTTSFKDNVANKTYIEKEELNTKLKFINIKYHFNIYYIEKNFIKL